MCRHTTEVTVADLRPLLLDMAPDGALLPPEERTAWQRDPTAPGRDFHLNFDQILRRCGYAWLAFLRQADDGMFGSGVIVPRLEVDYSAEVGRGLLHVDISVVHVGTTSFRLAHVVTQDGVVAARVEVVLVVFDDLGGTPLALSDDQRTFLQSHRD